jgi:hypothetical protein
MVPQPKCAGRVVLGALRGPFPECPPGPWPQAPGLPLQAPPQVGPVLVLRGSGGLPPEAENFWGLGGWIPRVNSFFFVLDLEGLVT